MAAWHQNGRKVVSQFSLGYVAALKRAHGELEQVNARLQAELGALRAELTEIRESFDMLRAATLACQKADTELAELYRRHAIERAQEMERDLAKPLN
jgi:hypothetical protein